MTTDYFFLVMSRLADFFAVAGISLAFIWGWLKKTKSPTGFMLNQFMSKLLRIALILVIYIFLFRFLMLIYFFVLLMVKGSLFSGSEYWERGKELQHIISYLIGTAFSLPILWIIGTTIWTSSLEHTLELINLLLPKSAKINTNKYRNSTVLDILNAVYRTDDNHSIDVTETVKRMISNNRLEITSSNDLVGGPSGDPQKGFHKNLIITYRINGFEKTEVIPEYRTKIIPD